MKNSKKIAATFPGQGSQFVGMSKELTENFPWTKQLFEEASESIKENLLRLCQEGPADSLSLTRNSQPAILTISYLWYSVLQRELDFAPDAGAGHSLGEYSALLASKALTLSEAVPLVRARGELMQAAVPVGTGSMAAVIGLEDKNVVRLCEKASQKGSVVVAANFNAPGQVVIAGHKAAVDRVKEIGTTTEDATLKVRRVLPLEVSAPFHSPLMSPIIEPFREKLSAVVWKKPQFPIVFNVTAERIESPDIIDLLSRQIDHPVRWTESVQSLLSYGIESFVEPGPGKVLTGLLKRIDPKAESFSVDSVEGLKKLEGVLKCS